MTQTGATRAVQYLLTDRLGSVDAVVDGTWAVVEARGYDAFGKPRTGTWADATPPRLASTANTPHGFTGHEHLNSLELIHMNGRVYDYNLGRFMEVDPIIQSPLNSQSLNPYSYLGNNPLSGTDPTGYMGTPACVAPHWVCQQMAMAESNGQGPAIFFQGIMAQLGLSQGGRPQSTRVSNFNGARSLVQLQKSGTLDKLLASNQRDNKVEPEEISRGPSATGASLGESSQEAGLSWDRIEAMTKAAAHEVDTRDYSYPGESFEQFNFFRNLKVQALTRANKYEYASSVGFRFTLNDKFGLEGQWSAAYFTSNSALSSVAIIRIEGDGWIDMPDHDMHSHGIIGTNYKLNHLEAAYANWALSSSLFHSGDRVNNISNNLRIKPILNSFSPADAKSPYPLWLSTVRGPIRGEPGNWP